MSLSKPNRILRRPNRRWRKRCERSYMTGWRKGYAEGQEYGRFLGRCEAVARSNPKPDAVYPLRLLFVVSGQGEPYAAIEYGIITELRAIVREVRAATPFEDVAGLAQTMRPDLVVVFNGLNYISEEWVTGIRATGVRTAVWFTDDPYYADVSGTVAGWYDVVLTQEKSCVELYKALGCPEVHYAPLGVFPALYRPLRIDLSDQLDVCFLGSGYGNRIELFDQLAPYLAGKKTLIAGRWWERLKHYELLKPKIRDGAAWLTPEATARCYSGAKLVINIHRKLDDDAINKNLSRIPAWSPNPRTFEINACGTLQLVDARDDMASFYQPGVEIETYSSPEELMHKIDYYLLHPERRKQIALNSLARTLREHTYAHRLQDLLKALFVDK